MGVPGFRLLEGKYSDDVLNRLHTARRPSTNQVYLSKFHVFTKYCQERGLNERAPSPGTVADFLNHLDVVKKLKPATIKAYRAAIGHMTRLETGYDPGSDEVCGLLIKSIERGSSPKSNSVIEWDVDVVLRALLAPENSDEQLTRHVLTAKTAFLLALATGERRSGLHALSYDAHVDLECPPHLHLHYVEGYVPKAWFLRTKKVSLENIVLPCVNDAAAEAICPVHTTIRYLELVSSSRTRAQTSLLIPHNPTNTNNLSVHAVARYIVKLVKWAYAFEGVSEMPRVHAHDTRKVAASLAGITGVALDEILKAGNWASATTYLRHYFKTFSPECVRNLHSVASVVAGKQLIDFSSVAEVSRLARRGNEASKLEAGNSRGETTRSQAARSPPALTTKSLEGAGSVSKPPKSHVRRLKLDDHDYTNPEGPRIRIKVVSSPDWIRLQRQNAKSRDRPVVELHAQPPSGSG